MHTPGKIAARLALLITAGCAAGTSAHAAEGCAAPYIKMIIPNPAGGVGDIIGRALGEKASAYLGKPVVIENRAGATTTIGTDMVAKAPADGCTILSLTASGVVASTLLPKLPYDLQRDFVPILGIGSFPMVATVSAGSKIQSFADLEKAAKSSQGLVYASGGVGTLAHLSAARLINDWSGTGLHVPYRGNADATQALLGNQVQLFFPSSAEAISLAATGKVRLLAITSDKRLTSLPDVPTMSELGFGNFNPRLWYAFLAPANTPPETVARLHDAFAKAVMDKSVQQRFSELGFAADLKDPAAVTAFMKSEAERWGKVIKDNNIQASQ
ncbi:tripartite tricarboxylate transporter substrate binding protein [Pigmentiphaga sp.]|uniref:Bug family tripartite tricarboxylate transporter substrate binding protein n=1 Tax=Pigmentiphaga sp. TaxID=1977564 RepID=UPI00128CEE78|nr:tripartite tricarboxylate transporter substrate binding protein [Pigmentiphaga sp.]MPS30189.1 tripartite tricarboxylate transporter substrate binding protein [Alcaligenaceae bacterium SAGV5]MPS55485.1 tripartite tricarboxylate transporter substrate binding protein [Alcaligenaceae bacterium SAGV3]MPT55432.1 tripartite tricarboxylate transporter substrate binding protein [Alcaligenaceae bacterium]